VLKAQEWVHMRDGRGVSLAAMATAAGLEQRTLELIAMIEQNDRDIEFVRTQAWPTGAERLVSAELVAREHNRT
jgi:hypothetical protein